jgi:hypothetical protein
MTDLLFICSIMVLIIYLFFVLLWRIHSISSSRRTITLTIGASTYLQNIAHVLVIVHKPSFGTKMWVHLKGFLLIPTLVQVLSIMLVSGALGIKEILSCNVNRNKNYFVFHTIIDIKATWKIIL